MRRTLLITLGCVLAMASGSALAQAGSSARGPTVTTKVKDAAREVGSKTKEAAQEVGKKTKEAAREVAKRRRKLR